MVFGWFRPTCPIHYVAKLWLEKRLLWLGEQFGMDVFTRRAVVLPTDDFFPDHYDGSEAAARRILERVCRYMEVDAETVALRLFTHGDQPLLVDDKGRYLATTAGLYQASAYETLIQLECSQLQDPMELVGTIAHELAHVRLLGEGRIDGDVYDNELLTDLTVVFHGLGIFLANIPRAWPSDFSTWPGTGVPRPEYMTQPMFGYALAHAAWLRGEQKSHWSRHLKMDAKASFRQGLRFLWKTRDSKLASMAPE